MSLDIATDYRARRYLVRTALSRWLATLSASGHAHHATDCPACGAQLHLERKDEFRAASCESPTCVKVVPA